MFRVILFLLGIVLFGSLGLWGCTNEDVSGTGTVALSLSGGEALREGFPHNEGGTTRAFVDGWKLQFSKFIVVIGDVQMTHPEKKEVVASWKGPMLVDMKSTAIQGGTAQGTLEFAEIKEVPARRLNVGFSLLSATAAAEKKNVEEADASEMIAQGWSVLFEGEANKDGVDAVKFRLGLKIPIRYSECSNGKDTTLGLAVESNKTTGALIYLHPIHLFWDSLGATNAKLRFDAFAAVAGDDKLVTAEELAQQDLTNLKGLDGNPLVDADQKRVYYDDNGLLPPDKLNLQAFLEFAVRDSVHFNGLGLCKSERITP
ncbi:MAG: hypothetical protein H6728_16445 [Myxococcales bacterium]|nr:hypothetical protein [Myxococcales bacterium]